MARFIQTAPGQQVNELYASEAVKRAAEQGTYKYVEEVINPNTQRTEYVPQMTSISSPTKAPRPVSAPNLPTPTAPQIEESYFTSSTAQVANARKSVEDAYKNELDRIEKERTEAQTKYDEYQEKQEVMLESDVKPLTEPFRQKLEESERKRLYIDENFQANQALTRELESLLTEGNDIIARRKEQPIALSVLNKQVNKTISDVAARVGVIEAVMSARSNQIGEAYRLIDRSVNAITADRKDRLDYYSTLYNFYEDAKDEEGKKIIELDKDQKEFLKAQIGLLENDLAQAQTNADNIKSLMTDPETALFMAEAGITLNDSPEEVSRKMGEQAARQEIKDTKNKLVSEGWQYVPFPGNRTDVQTFEVGGKTLAFVPPAEVRKKIGSGVDSTEVSDDPFIQELLNSSGGKDLADTSIQKLDKGLTVLAQLGVLQANIEDVRTGPLVGAFRSANPWDTNAQVIKAQLNAIVPNLARGVYGEVGVLTDNDIALYSRTIPNLKSTEEIRNAILYITLDMISKSIKNTLSVNAAANRDVSGFVDLYQEMENSKNLILSTIPGAQIPKAFNQSESTGGSLEDPLGILQMP